MIQLVSRDTTSLNSDQNPAYISNN